jgi:hypothetical protein
MKRGRPKKSVGYIRRAARRFLEGTRCRTPEEAVKSGARSLEEWVDVLRMERDAMRAAMDPSSQGDVFSAVTEA